MKALSKLSTALLAAGLMCSAQAADITVAFDADPVSLDPHEQLSGGTMQLSHIAFDPLVRFDQSFGFEARLAESWQRIDENTIRFTLRDGVQFHSGNPLTTKDVAWTLNRLQSSPDFRGLFAQFEPIKVIDDLTFELITKGPFPLVMQSATYIFPMDSKFYSGVDANGKDKGALVKHGSTYASGHISGTGPFIVQSREQGVKLKFARNGNYWDKASAGNVDNMTLVPIKESGTRVAALLSGDVDMIAPVAPTDHKRVKKTNGVELVTMGGTRAITFQLNQNTNEALKDVRVRQAIVHAINNQGIAKKIMRGFATPTGQMSPAGYAGYDADLAPRYDVKKAKALLKEAGYENGFSMSLIAPNNRYVNDKNIAQAVASMLAKIGIKVDVKTMPKAQYWPQYDLCEADMQMIGWHADTEDTANFFEFLLMSRNADTGAGQYNCSYSNSKLDKLVIAANSETDTAKRSALLQQAERIAYDDAALVPLHFQNLAWGARTGLDIAPVVNAMNFPYFGDLVVK
ncbi:ABC transporter substrate-binding protein [uncultured Ferrimonas sp.]|uniref:ABC transporter substrate-binding protein n=1 Tax=uncultured Ferrimonas sp. TaxID=432640 RepID=UPI00260A00DB|nr:ABC transporter substrate-binding protein [uncultured Ferrimonas sp.]